MLVWEFCRFVFFFIGEVGVIFLRVFYCRFRGVEEVFRVLSGFNDLCDRGMESIVGLKG